MRSYGGPESKVEELFIRFFALKGHGLHVPHNTRCSIPILTPSRSCVYRRRCCEETGEPGRQETNQINQINLRHLKEKINVSVSRNVSQCQYYLFKIYPGSGDLQDLLR